MKLSIKLIIFSIVLFTLNSCSSFGELATIGCVKPNSNSSVPLDELLSKVDKLIIDDKEYLVSATFSLERGFNWFISKQFCGSFSAGIKLPKGYIADKVWFLYLDKQDKKNIFIENDVLNDKNGGFYYYIPNIYSTPNKVIMRIKNNEKIFFVEEFKISINLR